MVWRRRALPARGSRGLRPRDDGCKEGSGVVRRALELRRAGVTVHGVGSLWTSRARRAFSSEHDVCVCDTLHCLVLEANIDVYADNGMISYARARYILQVHELFHILCLDSERAPQVPVRAPGHASLQILHLRTALWHALGVESRFWLVFRERCWL